MIDIDTIKRKLNDLDVYLDRTKIIIKKYDQASFYEDWFVQSSTERTLEIIIQIIIDICSHIVSNIAYPISTSSDCIVNLEKEGILEKDNSLKLIEAVKMRNLLVHQYAIIDYDLLYKAINKIQKDASKFKKSIHSWIETQ